MPRAVSVFTTYYFQNSIDSEQAKSNEKNAKGQQGR